MHTYILTVTLTSTLKDIYMSTQIQTTNTEANVEMDTPFAALQALLSICSRDIDPAQLINFTFHFKEDAGVDLAKLIANPYIRVRKAMIGWVAEYKKPV